MRRRARRSGEGRRFASSRLSRLASRSTSTSESSKARRRVERFRPRGRLPRGHDVHPARRDRGGVEFSGLLDIARPLLDKLSELPPGRASALESALGLAPSQAVDGFAVGAATLALLAAAAEEMPLLVLVDDVQWLDR